MARAILTVRLPKFTELQIDAITAKRGLTKTQLVILAVDRFAREMELGLDPESLQKQLAEIENAEATLEDD